MNFGMTNTSRLIELDGQKYILRTPGLGTDKLINRQQEVSIYEQIKSLHISDEVKYIDESGVKIAKFIEDARNCNPNDYVDVRNCIQFLKKNLHDKHLKCEHMFDLRERIKYYRDLAGPKSEYSDYEAVERKIMYLLKWVDTLEKEDCLTHIDANPDNFIIDKDNNIKLIDWEYAAMQDPHVDIAMFAIYSNYSRAQLDTLINFYFDNNVDEETKMKVYAYVAICGLLWSNWCEYKHNEGQTFGGEYELSQYRFAKDYSTIVLNYLCNVGYNNDCTKHIKGIILAAGKGERLKKLTAKTPKPLLEINDTKMIETCINALKAIGVSEIEIITGYKHEQFDYLRDDNIKLTYNEDFDKGNNILSLDKATTEGDVIILDADQVLNRTIFKTLDFSRSFYCHQINTDGFTSSDWEIETSVKDPYKISNIDVQMCQKDGKQLKSISFWKADDFKKIKQCVKENVREHVIHCYWDNIAALLIGCNDIKAYTYQLTHEEAIEIDTIDDYVKNGGTYNEEV